MFVAVWEESFEKHGQLVGTRRRNHDQNPGLPLGQRGCLRQKSAIRSSRETRDLVDARPAWYTEKLTEKRPTRKLFSRSAGLDFPRGLILADFWIFPDN